MCISFSLVHASLVLPLLKGLPEHEYSTFESWLLDVSWMMYASMPLAKLWCSGQRKPKALERHSKLSLLVEG